MDLDPQGLVSPARLRRAPGLPAASPHRRTRALLKVQDGCDYRCSFCIVPQVRGRSRSRPVEALVEDLRRLVGEGAPEVVLTGVHLGTYGRDLDPRRSLVDLVEALLPILGPARLRLSSLDPHEVSDGLVDLMSANPDRICRHLHLPTQSAEDGTLARMRRAHRARDFVRVVEMLADRIPGVALGTDVIVGHPGESEASFRETARVLASLPLAYLHVFPFSVRRGTPAAAMDDGVDPGARKERARILGELSRRMQRQFRRDQGGSRVDAVIYRRAAPEGLRGLTDNYLEVSVAGPDGLRGRRTEVLLGERGERATVTP
jgi:threonylcarbamoyladenosine tRNA methylthiotransferase MtaB